jgi:hypothetical protein
MMLLSTFWSQSSLARFSTFLTSLSTSSIHPTLGSLTVDDAGIAAPWLHEFAVCGAETICKPSFLTFDGLPWSFVCRLYTSSLSADLASASCYRAPTWQYNNQIDRMRIIDLHEKMSNVIAGAWALLNFCGQISDNSNTSEIFLPKLADEEISIFTYRLFMWVLHWSFRFWKAYCLTYKKVNMYWIENCLCES